MDPQAEHVTADLIRSHAESAGTVVAQLEIRSTSALTQD
jgi:hypothetical protein